jgi:WD40 repeat protein
MLFTQDDRYLVLTAYSSKDGLKVPHNFVWDLTGGGPAKSLSVQGVIEQEIEVSGQLLLLFRGEQNLYGWNPQSSADEVVSLVDEPVNGFFHSNEKARSGSFFLSAEAYRGPVTQVWRWSPGAQKFKKIITLPEDSAHDFALSRTGSIFALFNVNPPNDAKDLLGIMLYDADQTNRIFLSDSEHFCPGLVISPDGRHVASIDSSTSQLAIWETTKGERLFSSPLLKSRFRHVRFSNNGRFIIADDWDNRIHIFEFFPKLFETGPNSIAYR